MPISVKCGDCGKALKAPDALAGKKARCPDCARLLPFRKSRKRWRRAAADRKWMLATLRTTGADTPVEEASTRKPCPMCGELIAASATKCGFCGETLNSTVRSRERQSTSTLAANQLTGGDIAICVLCCPIACVVGIVAIITGQPARGLKMIGLALVMPFLGRAIMSIFQ